MSTSEKGHAKNLANANLINSYITQLGTIYQPSNPEIELTNLLAIYSNAYEKQQDIHSALPPYTSGQQSGIHLRTTKQKDYKIQESLQSNTRCYPGTARRFYDHARRIKGVRKTAVATTVPPETISGLYKAISKISFAKI